MKKLFLSALMCAGLLVAISSCNNETAEEAFGQVEDATDYTGLYDVQTAAHLAGLGLEEAIAEVEAAEKASKQGFAILSGVTGTRTLTNDTQWILRGPVVVGDGDVLTIEAGTVIKAFPGQTVRSSYLVVDRGGMVMAEGSATEPIIFTSLADRDLPGDDDLAGTLPAGVRGLWGGLIVLGNAPSNNGGDRAIEGIPEGGAVPNLYGGDDAMDNSGVFKFISIRHGGTEIGDGNEINGFTLGSVGAGTTVENIEVFANRDDAFEWFGGTVNSKNLIAAFCGDDSFDTDEGFVGSVQFGFAWLDIVGDRGGEHDSGNGDDCAAPVSAPIFANMTYRGAASAGSSHDVAQLRDNSALSYIRCVFTDMVEGVEFEDVTAGKGCSSFERISNGENNMIDNVFFNVGYNYGVTGDQSSSNFSTAAIQGVINGDPLFGDGEFTLVPSSGIAIFDQQGEEDLATRYQSVTGEALPTFFENTNFAGAFAPGAANQFNGWSKWSFVFTKPGGNLGPGTGTESPN